MRPAKKKIKEGLRTSSDDVPGYIADRITSSGVQLRAVTTRAERMKQHVATQLGWAIFTTHKDNEVVRITTHGEYFNRMTIDGVSMWLTFDEVTLTFEKAAPHLVCLGFNPETTTLEECFRGCEQLEMLDLSRWKTGKITSIENMLSGCAHLTTLDIGGWNTGSLQKIGGAFSGCASLASLDLSKWNTENLQEAMGVFYNCKSLTSLDLGKWNTESLQDAGYMFGGCENLTSLDLSKWNTESLQDADYMFGGCENLASLDLSKWNTESLRNTWRMFGNCTSLTSLDLSGWAPFVVEEIKKQCPKAVIKQ